MKWKELSDWKKSERKPLVVDGIIEGYLKRRGKFAFYWINRAGHKVFSFILMYTPGTSILSLSNFDCCFAIVKNKKDRDAQLTVS